MPRRAELLSLGEVLCYLHSPNIALGDDVLHYLIDHRSLDFEVELEAVHRETEATWKELHQHKGAIPLSRLQSALFAAEHKAIDTTHTLMWSLDSCTLRPPSGSCTATQRQLCNLYSDRISNSRCTARRCVTCWPRT